MLNAKPCAVLKRISFFEHSKVCETMRICLPKRVLQLRKLQDGEEQKGGTLKVERVGPRIRGREARIRQSKGYD